MVFFLYLTRRTNTYLTGQKEILKMKALSSHAQTVVLLCNAVLFQHKSKHFCTPYLPLELNNQMQVFSFGCNSSNVGSKQLFRKETTFQKKSVSMCIFSLLFSWGEKGCKPNLCQFNVVKSICGSFLR